MAEQAVRDIIGAFQTGMQEIARRRQLEQEQQRIQFEQQNRLAEQAARSRQLDIEEARNKQAADQFKMSHDLLVKTQDRQTFLDAQALAEKAAHGIPISGEQVRPSGVTSLGQVPFGGEIGLPGAGTVLPLIGQETHTFPQLTYSSGQPASATVPTPELQAFREAALQNIIKKPELETQLAYQEKLSEFNHQQQILVGNATFEHQKELENLKSTKAKELEGMKAISAEKIARIRQGNEALSALELSSGFNSNIQSVLDGTMSAEAFYKAIPPKLQLQARTLLAQADGNALPQKQVDQLNAILNLSHILPDALTAQQLRGSSYLMGTAPFRKLTENGRQLDGIMAGLREAAISLNRNQLKLNRVNNVELQRVDQFLMPGWDTPFFSPQAFVKNFNTLTGDLKDQVADIVRGLPPPQQLRIMTRAESLGLSMEGYKGLPQNSKNSKPGKGQDFQVNPDGTMVVMPPVFPK